jgi:hypothetical protein
MPTDGLDPDTGLPYPKLQVYVASEVPYLIRQAAEQAGYRHMTLWVRDRLARALADELDDEDYDEIMANMPAGWEQRPGYCKPSLPNKPGVHSGTGG